MKVNFHVKKKIYMIHVYFDEIQNWNWSDRQKKEPRIRWVSHVIFELNFNGSLWNITGSNNNVIAIKLIFVWFKEKLYTLKLGSIIKIVLNRYIMPPFTLASSFRYSICYRKKIVWKFSIELNSTVSSKCNIYFKYFPLKLPLAGNNWTLIFTRWKIMSILYTNRNKNNIYVMILL